MSPPYTSITLTTGRCFFPGCRPCMEGHTYTHDTHTHTHTHTDTPRHYANKCKHTTDKSASICMYTCGKRHTSTATLCKHKHTCNRITAGTQRCTQNTHTHAWMDGLFPFHHPIQTSRHNRSTYFPYSLHVGPTA